jgi:hypothetical protein
MSEWPDGNGRRAVSGCAQFGDDSDGAAAAAASSSSLDRGGAGLPGGGRCILEGVQSANFVPLARFAALIYKASAMPQLPRVLAKNVYGKPVLNFADRGLKTVGVMTMEPGS